MYTICVVAIIFSFCVNLHRFFSQCITCTWLRAGHLALNSKFDGGYTATAKAAHYKKDTARPRTKVRSRFCTFIFSTSAPDWVFTVLFYNTPTMSDEDPKDTALVTDTREEDVLPEGLIVEQAASDVLDPTLNKRAANEETSASNEVKNGGTT
jgi:hypothetical protein